MENEAWNIAQRYAFFVLNSVTMPPQQMENFSMPLEMIKMSRAQTFRWYGMFSESRTFVEDEQRIG